MADDIKVHFSEDEDLERVKAWWKSNGSSIVWGVAIGLSAVIGFNFWQSYTQGKAEGASALFTQISQDTAEDSTTVQQLTQELMDEYKSTPYASNAAMIMAKNKLESGNQAGAEEALSWVLDNSSDVATQHAARLRLAALRLNSDRVDEALQLLSVKDRGGFDSRYTELEGDAFLAGGDRTQAGEAYRKAMETMTPGAPYNQILQRKLDSVGAAKPAEPQ